MNIMKKKKSTPLVRGTIIHEMLEANIDTGAAAARKVLKAHKKKIGKIMEGDDFYGVLDEIEILMDGYFDYYKPDPLKYIKHQGKKSEFEFEIKLAPGIMLKGKVDSAARSQDKLVWLVEHKSHKQIPISEFKFTDAQSGLYTLAMPEVGLPKPDGVCWDYIKTNSPKKPEVLKSGELSKKKSINTTWPVYLSAIEEEDLDPSDYEDVREHLDGKEADFYIRVFLPISETFINNLKDEAIMTAREMEKRAGVDRTRSLGQHCSWCDMRDLCQASLLGLDESFILARNYMENDYGKTNEEKAKQPKRGIRLPKNKGQDRGSKKSRT